MATEIEINLEEENDVSMEVKDTGNVKIGVESDVRGTTDYSKLKNKPSINGVTIEGNKTLVELGIQASEEGKGLSTNDFTDSFKEKLKGLENYDDTDLKNTILDVYDIDNTIKTFTYLNYNSAPLLASYGHEINILKQFLLKRINIPIKLNKLKPFNLKIYKNSMELGKEIFSKEIIPTTTDGTFEIETNDILMIKGEKYYLVVATSDKSAILKYPVYNEKADSNDYFENTSNYYGITVEIPQNKNNNIRFNGEFVLNSKLDSNSFYESIEKFSNINEVICENIKLITIEGIKSWATDDQYLSFEDNIAHFNKEKEDVTSGNYGIKTISKIVNSNITNLLKLKSSIYNLGEKEIILYFRFYKKDGSLVYIPIDTIEISSSFIYKEYEIDLNYYVVYNDLDLLQSIDFIISGSKKYNQDFYIKQFDVEYYILKDGIINSDNSLNQNLNTLQEKIVQVENSIPASSNEDILKDENGNDYIMQINNGNLVVIPKIPKNVLYIGNSLLIGFDDFGMCASNQNEDYYAYLNSYLNEKFETLTTNKMDGTGFEGITDETAYDTWFDNNLLSKLSDETELVIIQLSDNINTEEKRTAFINSGANKILQYIRTNAPKSRIAWVSAWYSDVNNQTAISHACNKYGATFIDISDLYNVEGNQSYVGAIITKSDGSTIEVDSTGVASHPSSQGFRQIVDRMIEKLF